ncbi:MAG: hypothetical protein IJG68_01270 [Bacilli bacterium]|nr:hypothetical protein [Bacilli bacterium]
MTKYAYFHGEQIPIEESDTTTQTQTQTPPTPSTPETEETIKAHYHGEEIDLGIPKKTKTEPEQTSTSDKEENPLSNTDTSKSETATDTAGSLLDFNLDTSKLNPLIEEGYRIADRIHTMDEFYRLSLETFPEFTRDYVRNLYQTSNQQEAALQLEKDLREYLDWYSEAVKNIQDVDNTLADQVNDDIGNMANELDSGGVPVDSSTPVDAAAPYSSSPVGSYSPSSSGGGGGGISPYSPASYGGYNPSSYSTSSYQPISYTPSSYTTSTYSTSTYSTSRNSTGNTSSIGRSLTDPTRSFGSSNSYGSTGGYSGGGTQEIPTTINGGTSQDNLKPLEEDSKSSLLSSLEDGVKKTAARLTPTLKNPLWATGQTAFGQKSSANAALAGAGLAMGLAGIAGGIYAESKNGYYIFTPDDWNETEEEVQEAIKWCFKKSGMDDTEIGEFTSSSYKIKADDINTHAKKLKKALEINEKVSDEFIDTYRFTVFDEDNEVDKYLLFVVMSIDGRYANNEVNFYDIINPYFEDDDDIDFLYSGIDYLEYQIDDLDSISELDEIDKLDSVEEY